MGKRKSSAKPPPKRKVPKLPTSFACPFCNNPTSVKAKKDIDKGVGEVSCSICKARYKCKITKLTEPIDMHSDWIDACEAINT